MSYLRYLCLFAMVLSSTYCLRLVYPMLSVSLDCPLFSAPSVFTNCTLLLQDIFPKR
jgi:hypothetical protein